VIERIHKALLEFWESFGIPAYVSGYVYDPEKPNAEPEELMPYITFEVVRGDYFVPSYTSAVIWDFSRSFTKLWAVAGAIEAAIPAIGGYTVDFEGGFLRIMRGSPFIQIYPQEQKDITALYINIEITSYAE